MQTIEKETHLGIRISVEMRDALKKEAEKEGFTSSQLVRKIIKIFLYGEE